MRPARLRSALQRLRGIESESLGHCEVQQRAAALAPCARCAWMMAVSAASEAHRPCVLACPWLPAITSCSFLLTHSPLPPLPPSLLPLPVFAPAEGVPQWCALQGFIPSLPHAQSSACTPSQTFCDVSGRAAARGVGQQNAESRLSSAWSSPALPYTHRLMRCMLSPCPLQTVDNYWQNDGNTAQIGSACMLPGARNVPGNPFNMDPTSFCQNQVRSEWAAV
jgi:hypothetical protein